jgi:hypothetical protein
MGKRRKDLRGKKSVTAAGSKKAKPSAQDEKLQILVGELRDVAESIGIRVRRERLKREVGYSVRSGLCLVEGEEVLLLESDLSPDIQVDLLVGVLAGRDLSLVELTPDTRRLLQEV